jgi:hypothetical protein
LFGIVAQVALGRNLGLSRDLEAVQSGLFVESTHVIPPVDAVGDTNVGGRGETHVERPPRGDGDRIEVVTPAEAIR